VTCHLTLRAPKATIFRSGGVVSWVTRGHLVRLFLRHKTGVAEASKRDGMNGVGESKVVMV
jgi:hypothetical protein